MGPREKRNSEFECSQVLQAVRNADQRGRRLVLDKEVLRAGFLGGFEDRNPVDLTGADGDVVDRRGVAGGEARDGALPDILYVKQAPAAGILLEQLDRILAGMEHPED